jgi:hypothetical protein
MNVHTKVAAIGRAKALAARFPVYSPTVQMIMEYSRFGTWLKKEVNRSVPSFPGRRELYEFVTRSVLGGSPVDLLEFGVFRGESMRLWADASGHPDSRFVGFDGFEGLPEKWQHLTFTDDAHTFDVGGAIPSIDDRRVSFVKGWFQDTLPVFLQTFKSQGQLIIHLDADLYSSTLFVLTAVAPHVVPGTVMLFDEFSSTSMAEFRAFIDYSSAYRCRYRVLAWSGAFYDQLCVQVLE